MGGKPRWIEDPDNPMSHSFLKLTVRTEADKARWWARVAPNLQRKTHGEFDP